MSYNTRSNALWNAHRLVRQQQDKEQEALAREEFPPGTRVKWVHSFERGTNAPIYRRGEVVRLTYGCRLECRMMGKTATHPVYSHDLQFDEAAS